MRRIAIIDHNEHDLIIEDINEEVLEKEYGGDEQKYIDDNYDIENYEHRQAILALNGLLAVGFFNNWGRIRAQDHINKVIRHIRTDTANTV